MSWTPQIDWDEEHRAIREAKMEQVERAEGGERVPYYARTDADPTQNPFLVGYKVVQKIDFGDGTARFDMQKHREAFWKRMVAIGTLSDVKPHADDQTAQHLTALDAALGKAVDDCQRVGGWVLKKSSPGWHVYHQTGLYLHVGDQTMAEMIHAVLAGDLLTALQKRDELHESLPVVP